MLTQPPRLYLDTCHLINISNARCGRSLAHEGFRDAYSYLDSLLQGAGAGLIFNSIAALEWMEGNATLQSARRIAAVIDSARLQYDYEGDVFIFTKEVLAECGRLRPDLDLPDLPAFELRTAGGTIKTALGTLAAMAPDYLRQEEKPAGLKDAQPSVEIPVLSASQYVAQVPGFAARNPGAPRERIEGFRAAFETNKCGFAQHRQPNFVEWAIRLLKIDRVLAVRGLSFADSRALLQLVEIDHCPAIKLLVAAQAQLLLSTTEVTDNDVDDWFFVAVVPYADLVLTDRRFRAILVQADPLLRTRVFSDPDHVRDALVRLLS